MVNEERKICVNRWHEVLGHRNFDAVKGIPKADVVHGMKIVSCDSHNEAVCTIGSKRKMSRPKFPKESLNCAKALLDLIHSDIFFKEITDLLAIGAYK